MVVVMKKLLKNKVWETVFGLKSDKVRRGAIAKGNALTFKQVYDFAKVDESTIVEMKTITLHEKGSELHAVRSRKKPTFFKKPRQEPEQKNTDSKGDPPYYSVMPVRLDWEHGWDRTVMVQNK